MILKKGVMTMGIRFYDYDDATDRDVEIKGKDFERLLDLCFCLQDEAGSHKTAR